MPKIDEEWYQQANTNKPSTKTPMAFGHAEPAEDFSYHNRNVKINDHFWLQVGYLGSKPNYVELDNSIMPIIQLAMEKYRNYDGAYIIVQYEGGPESSPPKFFIQCGEKAHWVNTLQEAMLANGALGKSLFTLNEADALKRNQGWRYNLGHADVYQIPVWEAIDHFRPEKENRDRLTINLIGDTIKVRGKPYRIGYEQRGHKLVESRVVVKYEGPSYWYRNPKHDPAQRHLWRQMGEILYCGPWQSNFKTDLHRDQELEEEALDFIQEHVLEPKEKP